MKKQDHLPLMGVGPFIVGGQLIITAGGITLSCLGYLYGEYSAILKTPLLILGVILILLGIVLWYSANFKAKIDEGITNNQLVTTGVYAWVRNPIYSAFFLVCLGAVLISNNPVLLFVPVLNWIYMTIFLKLTEEKWLENLYGAEYLEYCKRVNRCIPWF